MVQQRRSTRQDSMATRSLPHGQEMTSQRWSYKTLFSVAGIAVCGIIAVYFAITAPDSEPNHKVKDVDPDWYEVKKNWRLEHLTEKQWSLVTEAVKIERLNNEYLRNFMIVRPPGSKNITKVKRFIIKTLMNLGWEIEEDSFSDYPPKAYSMQPVKFTNVIATHNPYSTRRLVLACHYDSKVTPEGFLGAVDSAVPCSMLLEIANVLKPYLSKDSDPTLQLLFLDGEEAFVQWTALDSIYGARHLAQKWQSQRWPPGSNGDSNTLHSIDLFVLLDLLGEKQPTFYDFKNVHKSGHYKELVRIEKRLDDDLTYFNPKAVGSRIEDDHIPFYKRNVPILHIIPQPFPVNWHQIGDNGTNIDNPTVERLTKIFALFVSEYLHLKPYAY